MAFYDAEDRAVLKRSSLQWAVEEQWMHLRALARNPFALNYWPERIAHLQQVGLTEREAARLSGAMAIEIGLVRGLWLVWDALLPNCRLACEPELMPRVLERTKGARARCRRV